MASLRSGVRCLRDLGSHTAAATTRTLAHAYAPVHAPARSLHLPMRSILSQRAPNLHPTRQPRRLASTTDNTTNADLDAGELDGDAALEASLLKAGQDDPSLGFAVDSDSSLFYPDEPQGRIDTATFLEQEYEHMDTPLKATHVRAVPLSPSYFARQINFLDAYLHIQDLYRRYQHLPTVKPGTAEIVTWTSKTHYTVSVGEPVKTAQFNQCIRLARRLHQIHPDVKPQEVREGIQYFMRAVNKHAERAKPVTLDQYGRAHGVGRRKTSSARAWVVQGTGEIIINGVPIHDAFARLHDRESAVWALKTMNRMDKYNVFARVDGGGTTGQAEALAMAIAKAMTGHEPALKTALRKGTSPISYTIAAAC